MGSFRTAPIFNGPDANRNVLKNMFWNWWLNLRWLKKKKWKTDKKPKVHTALWQVVVDRTLGIIRKLASVSGTNRSSVYGTKRNRHFLLFEISTRNKWRWSIPNFQFWELMSEKHIMSHIYFNICFSDVSFVNDIVSRHNSRY